MLVQGPSLATTIQLGAPALTQKQVPEDVRDILKPTSARYRGPIDLDEAVAQRVEDINRTWLASTGEDTASSLLFTVLQATRAPVLSKSTLNSAKAQSSL